MDTPPVPLDAIALIAAILVDQAEERLSADAIAYQ